MNLILDTGAWFLTLGRDALPVRESMVCSLRKKRMSPELSQWIPPAVIVGVTLYLHRVNRHDIKGIRGDVKELRVHIDAEIGNLRDHVDAGIGNLRDRMDAENGNLRDRMDTGFRDLRNRMGRLEERMARLEGTLDVLREFFVRNGRGTAA